MFCLLFILVHCQQSAIEDAGRVGLTMVLMGVLGSIAGGLVLDTWHKFK